MTEKIVLSPQIKGIIPGLPEIGKIKIGMKGDQRQSRSGGSYQLPVKLDHFVVTTLERGEDGNFLKDREVHNRFGEKPTELPVILLYNDPSLNFQSRWACFVGTRLWCTGDGENAIRKQKDGSAIHWDCTCERAAPDFKTDQYRCKTAGVLSVMLADMENVGGVYKFRTTSYNTVVNIMSSMALIQRITGGTLAGIPLTMAIRPKTVVTPIDNKTQKVYVVGLEFKGSMPQLQSTAYRATREQLEYKQRIEDLENGVRALIGNEILTEEETNEDIAAEFYPEAQEGYPEASQQAESAGKGPGPETDEADYSKLVEMVEAATVSTHRLKDFVELTAKSYETTEQEVIEQGIAKLKNFLDAYSNWLLGTTLDESNKLSDRIESDKKDTTQSKQNNDNEPEPDTNPRNSDLYKNFDPYTSQPQKRYDARLILKMTDELSRRDIKFAKSMTGIQLHQLLLQQGIQQADHGGDEGGGQETSQQATPDQNPGYKYIRKDGEVIQNDKPTENTVSRSIVETDEFNELMMLQQRHPESYARIMKGKALKTVQDIEDAISAIDADVEKQDADGGSPKEDDIPW